MALTNKRLQATQYFQSSREEIRDYFEVIELLKQRTSSKPWDAPPLQSQLSSRCPFAFKLLTSFACSAPGTQDKLSPKFEEWNPLIQRLQISERSVSAVEVIKDFEKVEFTLMNFLDMFHESAHCMMWEPFFTGKSEIRSAQEFKSLNLAFEGFCFWYSDILLSPLFRAHLPDGEFIFSRTFYSHKYFHPYRAFQALGISDLQTILGMYLESFQGRSTPLLIAGTKKNPDVFATNMSRRVYGFYEAAGPVLASFYKGLKKADFFSEFQNRFCKIDQLPSLFPGTLKWHSNDGEATRYGLEVAQRGLSEIAGLTEQNLERVRMRRHLQTRAYNAFMLKHAVQSGQTFSLNESKYDRNELVQRLENYLLLIEQLLVALSKKSPISRLIRACTNADMFYSREIRSFFEKHKLWMSQRYCLLPGFYKVNGLSVGFISAEELREKQFKAMVVGVVRKIYPMKEKYSEKKWRSTQENETALFRLVDYLSIQGKKRWSKHQWASIYNRALLANGILQQWSVPLTKFDPAQNQFTDPLFHYE